MNKKDLIAAAIPVLELIQLLITSFAQKWEEICSYSCSQEEYEKFRKLMYRHFRVMSFWD